MNPLERWRKSSKFLTGAILVLLIQMTVFVGSARGELRRVSIGDKMPEFSGTDVDGNEFEYKHGRHKVLVLAFLSADQKQSQQAARELQEITAELGEGSVDLDFVVVADNPNIKTYVAAEKKKSQSGIHLLVDGESKLWGLAGVIATPTLIIVGKDDTIVWAKGGYGYHFAPSARLHVKVALGIADEKELDELAQVRTLTHGSAKAKAERHIQMAGRLEEKGRLDSAIRELHEAQALNPDSVETIFRLGELYCRTGQSKEALEAVSDLKAESRAEKARTNLISGWAKRQMGELEEAENLLRDAATLDPGSSRAFFELGKIYQTKGLKDRAIEAYRKALSLIFGEQAFHENSQR